MKRYEEALADFDRAIALDEKYAWAIASRGEIYRLMKRYEEALADFDHAIALNEKSDWYRYLRAQVYLAIVLVYDSARDLNDAIEFVQLILNLAPKDWLSNFNLALYKLSAEHSDAEVFYDQLASMCSSILTVQE